MTVVTNWALDLRGLSRVHPLMALRDALRQFDGKALSRAADCSSTRKSCGVGKALGLATDCSGMGTPMMALRNLGLQVNHLFACDVDRHAKATIMANFPPQKFYSDLRLRDNRRAPRASLYVAGFPCQPFSSAGTRQGFADAQGRGTIFWQVRDYISIQQPPVFLLENVKGLMFTGSGEYFRAILQSLKALGTYNIYHELLNTRDHGLPQNRPRVFIVGILKAVDQGTFIFLRLCSCQASRHV